MKSQLKFGVTGNGDVVVPAHCSRCGRRFRAGERVVLSFAGVYSDLEVLERASVNMTADHENVDMCTEGR